MNRKSKDLRKVYLRLKKKNKSVVEIAQTIGVSRQTIHNWNNLPEPDLFTKPSVIIMDNTSFHKGKELKELFEKHNHKLVFLPAYSPELNPIENMWGTIKQNFRSYYDYNKNLFENLSYWVCECCM